MPEFTAAADVPAPPPPPPPATPPAPPLPPHLSSSIPCGPFLAKNCVLDLVRQTFDAMQSALRLKQSLSKTVIFDVVDNNRNISKPSGQIELG